MIVLDASVLIAYLDSDDTHHAVAEAVLAEALDDDFAANPLTLAEVLVAPARQGRLDLAQSTLRALEVTEMPFPPDTSARLAQLRASTGLKMPDSCVLLAAEQADATIASFDDRLRHAAAKHNLSVLPA